MTALQWALALVGCGLLFAANVAAWLNAWRAWLAIEVMTAVVLVAWLAAADPVT